MKQRNIAETRYVKHVSEQQSDHLRDQFCGAMRRLAATVNIVTTIDEGKPVGMLATAVTSLCADPPTVIFCINQSATMYPALAKNPRFTINMLHVAQTDYLRIFSDPVRRHLRFADDAWIMRDGTAMLDRAQSIFNCEVDRLIEYGTHSIVIGAVRSVLVRPDVDPLIYVDGRHARIG